jgi:hypothetical protein
MVANGSQLLLCESISAMGSQCLLAMDVNICYEKSMIAKERHRLLWMSLVAM